MRTVRGPGARPDGPGSAERGHRFVVPVGRWGSHTWTTADGDAPCPGATGRSRPRPGGLSVATAPRHTARRPGGLAGRRCRPSNRRVRRSPTRCPGCAMPSGPMRRDPVVRGPAVSPSRGHVGGPGGTEPTPRPSPDAASSARPGATRRRRHPRRGVRGDRRTARAAAGADRTGGCGRAGRGGRGHVGAARHRHAGLGEPPARHPRADRGRVAAAAREQAHHGPCAGRRPRGTPFRAAAAARHPSGPTRRLPVAAPDPAGSRELRAAPARRRDGIGRRPAPASPQCGAGGRDRGPGGAARPADPTSRRAAHRTGEPAGRRLDRDPDPAAGRRCGHGEGHRRRHGDGPRPRNRAGPARSEASAAGGGVGAGVGGRQAAPRGRHQRPTRSARPA